ncbi:MAG: BCCT family transporter [Actinomycetia bacterium]|nr:BCCT family transporter [Actinomycetes bacterium]
MTADTDPPRQTAFDPPVSEEPEGGDYGPPPANRDFRGGWATIDKTVFLWAFGIIAIICIIGAVWSDKTADWSGEALGWVTDSLGWLIILSASGFVIFSLVLAFGRYGRIPLSRNGEEPEFKTISWIAMMFSAGMGIGLMFYGVFEPVTHMSSPPPFVDAEPNSAEAAQEAMAITFFHWGLHPWGMYAVVGLALAYSTFRLGRGNLLSAPFESLMGKERMRRGWGKPIDILAIICTKFGSAVSLGLGALQIAAGIALLKDGEFPAADDRSHSLAIIVIMVLTVGIVLSAASGVAKGIQWLSNINMIVAFVLVVFVFVVGPTVFMLDLLPNSIGAYVSNIIPLSFNSAAFGGADTASWLSSWTIFYWAWWISWTPFVGTFIARISRGRTIREFVLGVMLVPTAISIVWFVIFGGAGIDLQLGGVDIAGAGDEAAGFFAMLQEYPFWQVTAGVVIFLTSIFFVSGADAGALVLSTLSSRGRKEPWEPLVVLWAVMTGVVAAVLLAVGGLQALKTFAILAATPFVLVLIVMCFALYADLRRDPLRQRRLGGVREHTPAAPEYAPFSDADLATNGNGNGTSGDDASPEQAEVSERQSE